MLLPRMPPAALLIGFGAVVFLLQSCASSAGKEVPDSPEPAARQVEVFYATDRAPSASAGEYYGPDRGSLSFGLAAVGIPPTHQMGRQEKPSVFKFEWSPDERKHVALKGTTPLGQEEFFVHLAQAVSLAPGQKVLVFAHGYNVRFADAVSLVAQFATDLKFSGPILLFSWPSQGSLTGYPVDETNVEWAQSDLVHLLDDLLNRTPAQQVYLFAHSMGARILTHAFNTLAADRGVSRLGQVREMVLVAPDIDADVFRNDVAVRLARNGIHTTLYASSSDRALIASKAFHGYPRAGDSGEGLVIVGGVETVDASEVSSGFLGHSYFAEDRRIMEDIYGILQTGQRADKRFGLEGVNAPAGRYWTFRK